ncbi:deoxyribose-phosphate aldolase [uncultured Lacinutrix sp.]|uniref:deoxyribose-phosphate aldolase n=1 Tax=uncultured Lacinutrix sp. TaxID=574032 RepID=UPI002603ECB3|nr:deoxyribose-phosphate aldolase [uncultured Lacinutrix sp.]
MNINQYIDHTLLKPTATITDIIALCNEAKTHKFHAICVNSCYVALAKAELKDSAIKVCSVIGFPLGAMSTEAKVEEAKQALKDGADEIDMVINIGFLKSKDFDAVWKDIEAVKKTITHTVLKVIIETCYLDTIEIIKASELAINSGADYIKTSTGFGSKGTTIEAVQLIKGVINNCEVKIKASGGIRDTKTALEYINLGVSRIGTSNGVAIVTNTLNNTNNY